MKSRTNVHGKVVNGDLHVAMNLRDIIESTPEPSHSSVVTVIVVSHVPIIWHCTWNVMFKWFQSIHRQIRHQPPNSSNGFNKWSTNTAKYQMQESSPSQFWPIMEICIVCCHQPGSRFLLKKKKHQHQHQPELKHEHKRKICNFIFHFSYTLLNKPNSFRIF